MYTEDARWYRARMIRYTSGTSPEIGESFSIHRRLNSIDHVCEVFYIDYGNLEELSIDLVHEILPDFTRLPARAIACTIAGVRTSASLFKQHVLSDLDTAVCGPGRLDETSDVRLCVALQQ